jgi:hypothetical protein
MGVLSRFAKHNVNRFKELRYKALEVNNKREDELDSSIIAIVPDAIIEENEEIEVIDTPKPRRIDRAKEKENQLYNVAKELRTDQENEIELDIPKHKARKYLTKVKEFLNYKMNRPEKRVEKKVKLDSELLVKYEFDGINWTPRTESKD